MSTAVASRTRYLSQDQVAFFWEHGYLRMEQVFTPDEVDELDTEMDRLMVEWANYYRHYVELRRELEAILQNVA